MNGLSDSALGALWQFGGQSTGTSWSSWLTDMGSQIADQTATGDAFRYLLTLAICLLLAVLFTVMSRGGISTSTGRRVSFGRRLLTWALVMILVSGAAQYQVGQILRERRFKLVEDTLYLPSARTVRLVALGYDEALAGLLFLRAIQAYGAGWQFTGKGGRPKLFEHYYDVITDLDPKFIKAYTFGSMMIGEEMRAPAPAFSLLVKGLHLNPDNHDIPYSGGFFATEGFQDHDRAIRYLKVATQPGRHAPDWVERQIGYFGVKGGQFRGGIERYLEILLRAIDNSSYVEEMIGRGRLITTQQDWGAHVLKNAINEYRETHGSLPEKLDDLVGTEALKDYEYVAVERLIPPDPAAPSLLDYADPTKKLLEQMGEIRARLFVRLQGRIPPTPEGRGWLYTRLPDGTFDVKALEGLNQWEIIRGVRESVKDAIGTLGAPPATDAGLMRVLGRPDFPADPDRTFLFYNPMTGEAHFASILLAGLNYRGT